MTSLAIVVTGSIAVSAGLGHVDVRYLVGPGVTLTLFVAGAIAGRRLLGNQKFRTNLANRSKRFLTRFDVTPNTLTCELDEVATNLRLRNLAPVGGWAALSWVVDAAALGLTFAAFGSTLNIGVLMVGYGLANLISALPELTPGWLGVLEATLAGTYGAFGVPAGTAVLAVLSYRLVSYWLPVIAGLVPAAGALKGSGRRRIRRMTGRVRSMVPAWSR